jgi:hypothetical protein
MMLCLALRSSPERVYERALRQFTMEEVSEGFAAARGLALPSQLRRMIRAQGRDLHAEFVRLLPSPPHPIRIQRWSVRRVGLLALVAVLLAFLGTAIVRGIASSEAGATPLYVGNLGCTDLEPLWLEAQAVPSATLVPCVRAPLPGWTVASVAVNDGRAVITLDNDRAGKGAVAARLTAACDPVGAAEVPSQVPGVRRYEQVERRAAEFTATWYDRFQGGCVTYRLHSRSDSVGGFAIEAPSLLGFTTRASLRGALSQRSDGRLQLDPNEARSAG